MIKIIKKDGSLQNYDSSKVIAAVRKSAARCMCTLSNSDERKIAEAVKAEVSREYPIETDKNIPVATMHKLVEVALRKLHPEVATSYAEYRNYKTDFIRMVDDVYNKSRDIMYMGDKENSNTDSALVSTKRSLIFNQFNKELYQKFFLTNEELKACRDGYIYVHDMSARRDTMNCCLFDVANVMRGGFEMGNLWYNEPKSLDVAFDVIGDIVMSAASQQYGGFTVPEIDQILAPYAERSYNTYRKEYINLTGNDTVAADKYAFQKVSREMEQGFQGLEYKFNSVSSSRGDYPFITMTLGLETNRFGKLASKTALRVRMNGQGKSGNKKPVLFPKIVFLYDENLHGVGKINEDVFDAGIDCSSKAMYPDWLSLTGDGYVASMYKKYGKVVHPMGCVDGQEVVTYKFNSVLYVESFKRMWGRISDLYSDIGQHYADDANRVIDLRKADVQIYDTKKGFVKVKYLIRNLQDNWCDVKLSGGRVLRTTTDHPFETGRGVVLAENLTTTDTILVNHTQYSEDSINYNEDLAWAEGLILCDGCYQNSTLVVSLEETNEDDIRDHFVKVMRNQFDADTRIIHQNRGKKGVYQDIRVLSGNKPTSKSLCKRYESMFEGVNKVERQIPNEVFRYSKSAKYAFLAGMVDADGYINNSAKLKQVTVQIGSTNKELALQQLALAQSLGMPAKMYHNHYNIKNPNKIRYRIEFAPNEELIDALHCQKKKNHFKPTIQSTNIVSESRVLGVSPIVESQYSYDVTTESEHFEVSGVYSHNCRAFLSPWYERGGISPADEADVPVFVGRFNIGAISLHLPMILAKARAENKPFYSVLDYYLEMIRGIHLRTYEYLGEMRASTNPLAYCEGGFYGGHLHHTDSIKPLLKSATASFGITALNEFQMYYNGLSLTQDAQESLDVMGYINSKLEEFKAADGVLYAIYGTPAENLCFTGDTLIQTYEGDKPIKDVKVGDYVYSYNDEKRCVELKSVLASELTSKKVPVIKVVFDNGQQIRCTPDHPIGVRKMIQNDLGQTVDNTTEYVKAKDLKVGMSIKSNYITTDRVGRLRCSIYKGREYQLLSDIVAECFLGEPPADSKVLHINGDRMDVSKENLCYVPKSEYRSRMYQARQGVTVEEVRTEMEELGMTLEEYADYLGMQINRSVCQFDLDGNLIATYECAESTSKSGFTPVIVRTACKGLSSRVRKPEYDGHYYKGYLWFYEKPERNHKVVSVAMCMELEDVYNLNVQDNHNYFVGGCDGILVHNCGLQVKQFRSKYGVVEGVSDKPYVSNSFHCHVTEEISPIEKQDLEGRFWNLFNGGKIQYVKYPISYNRIAIETLVRRAMDKGFYEGVNLSLSYCNDCGHEELNMDVCPKCGSHNLTKIERMNGYLSYSRVNGDTRLNEAKMAEIADRKSM